MYYDICRLGVFMKRYPLNSILAALLICVTSAPSAYAACPKDCAANDQACVNAQLACVANDASSSAAGALLGVVALGVGVWWALSKDDADEIKENEMAARFDEVTRGMGLRISDFESSYRIAVLPLLDEEGRLAYRRNLNALSQSNSESNNGGFYTGLLSVEVDL
jgi:hypothetical protein